MTFGHSLRLPEERSPRVSQTLELSALCHGFAHRGRAKPEVPCRLNTTGARIAYRKNAEDRASMGHPPPHLARLFQLRGREMEALRNTRDQRFNRETSGNRKGFPIHLFSGCLEHLLHTGRIRLSPESAHLL